MSQPIKPGNKNNSNLDSDTKLMVRQDSLLAYLTRGSQCADWPLERRRSVSKAQLPLPGLHIKGAVKFPRPFATGSTPKALLWISGMDFSKANNGRLQAQVLDVTSEGFTLNIGPWDNSTLYHAEVTWIAHADISGIQSGKFSTEDVRSGGQLGVTEDRKLPIFEGVCEPSQIYGRDGQVCVRVWDDITLTTRPRLVRLW